jgi:hypothetical protein
MAQALDRAPGRTADWLDILSMSQSAAFRRNPLPLEVRFLAAALQCSCSERYPTAAVDFGKLFLHCIKRFAAAVCRDYTFADQSAYVTIPAG